MKLHAMLALVLCSACAKSGDEDVAKRDTGVAPARITTETVAPASPADTLAPGVPAVPSESPTPAQRDLNPGLKRIEPPPESLRVKP
jgi:hypothetical protein